MKPITQLYRIVEGALKDDISMVMRYAKRLMRNNSMDIDWDETEKGIQEILNAHNNRPANIATLDNDNSITIISTILKSDTPDSNGRVYSKEALENAVKEYNENRGNKTQVEFGPYKGTEDGRLVEVDFGEIWEDMFGKEHKIAMKFANDWQSLKNDPIYQELNDMVSEIYEDRITIDEEIKEQAHWLANNFSTRNGYTSMEENLIKMGKFVKNRMLDKYNLKNE
jgi:hypothetical protein